MLDKSYLYILFVIAMLFLASYVRKSAYLDRRTNRMYLASVISNILTFVGYIGRELSVPINNRIFSYLTNDLIYIMGLLMPFFLVLSACKKNGIIYKIMLFLEAVDLLCIFTSPFTGFVFTIGANGEYTRGAYTSMFFALGGIEVLLGFIAMSIKYKGVESRDKLRLFLMCILEAVAILLQTFDGAYKYQYLGASFLLVLFYVFMIETEGKYDMLTSCGSLRYYNQTIDSLKPDSDYTVILADVNGLKKTNDIKGHEIGDELIKAVAACYKQAIGSAGKLFRIGGDEYVAIINGSDKDKITEISRKIDDKLNAKSKDSGYEISASMGVAIHEIGEDFADTVRRADNEMYENKKKYYERTGKDRRA